MKLYSDERKIKAHKYLKRIKEIENKIRRKMVEKRRWFELATNTASNMSDDVRVQSSGKKEKMADVVVTGVFKEEKYDKEIAKLNAERQAIIDVIESLPEPYCDILYRLYVEHQSLKEAAFERKDNYHVTSNRRGAGLLMVYDVVNNNKQQ